MSLELRILLLLFLLNLESKMTLLLGARSEVGLQPRSLDSGVGRGKEKAGHE